MSENMKKDGEMEFPAFPYKPYSIQLDFMKFLYQSLERGGISVLESPTGMSPRLACLIFFFSLICLHCQLLFLAAEIRVSFIFLTLSMLFEWMIGLLQGLGKP